RQILARAAVAYDEQGRLPGTWFTVILAGVLLSAVVTDKIGVAVILGAFLMGLHASPRRAQQRGHQATRGLRADAPAPAVLRLHGVADQHRRARPDRTHPDHARTDRDRNHRQVRRHVHRGAHDEPPLAT